MAAPRSSRSRGSLAVAALVPLCLLGCKTGAATTPPLDGTGGTTPQAIRSSTPPSSPEPDLLPPPAPRVGAEALAGDASCGPWSTKELTEARELLEDRVGVRFLPGAQHEGGTESGRLEITHGEHTIFVGARETYQRADELFDRRAAKAARFGGDYDPIDLPSRDGKTRIVAGLLRAPTADAQGMVALAHGWFTDANRDVVDVAVFASAATIVDIDACRRFAQRVLTGAAPGGRALDEARLSDTDATTHTTTTPATTRTTTVAYATFAYPSTGDWIVTSAFGRDDFARIQLRRRSAFPHGFTFLELALDAHPGDWTSPGAAEGEREGHLLGREVSWHLTREENGASRGAWTRSSTTDRRDYAVASIRANDEEARDDALRFAESVGVTHR